MRELIFLSQGKLSQFQHDTPGWWRQIQELGLRAPFNLGEIRFAHSNQMASRRPSLARVLRHINNSTRPPKWFTDEGLQPGDWIQFEAPLNYKYFEKGKGLGRQIRQKYSAILFWDVQLADTTCSPARLLLHGSPENLVDRVFIENAQRPIGGKIGPSSPPGILSLLGEPRMLGHILGMLSESMPAETASWMSGYARVTMNAQVPRDPSEDHFKNPCIVSRVVVASPLYVEYVTAPAPD